MDSRIPVIATIGVVVIAAFLFVRKRELARLHKERGYDASDPNLDREAMLNTKAKFRVFNEGARRYLDIARGIFFAPLCALLAIAFFWAGWPNRWEMFGLGALFALGAWFFTNILFKAWRAKRSAA